MEIIRSRSRAWGKHAIIQPVVRLRLWVWELFTWDRGGRNAGEEETGDFDGRDGLDDGWMH